MRLTSWQSLSPITTPKKKFNCIYRYAVHRKRAFRLNKNHTTRVNPKGPPEGPKAYDDRPCNRTSTSKAETKQKNGKITQRENKTSITGLYISLITTNHPLNHTKTKISHK